MFTYERERERERVMPDFRTYREMEAYFIYRKYGTYNTTSTMTKPNLLGGTEPTQPPGKRKKQAVMTTRSSATKAMYVSNTALPKHFGLILKACNAMP